MDGCLGDNSNPNVTQTIIFSCLFEKIQSKYTLEEFMEISKLKEGVKFEEYQLF